MERLDESGQVAESGSPDRARWPLRYDQSGATFEEPEPDWRSPASPSPSSSPASTQLPGAGGQERPGSPTAADAEQAVDPAAEADQHQLPQAERFAHSWPAHEWTACAARCAASVAAAHAAEYTTGSPTTA